MIGITAINVILDVEGAFSGLKEEPERTIIHVQGNQENLTIGGLPGGMSSGAPSVMIRVDLPDGKIVIAETSLKLFLMAADSLQEYYNVPFRKELDGDVSR